MLGYIEYAENSTKAYLERQRRCGAPFLVLDMGSGAKGALASYRAARAAKKMRALGMRRAVFPVDFPHTAAFLRSGIAPVDPLALRRALGARFVKRQFENLGISNTRSVVAVSADAVSGEVARTVQELAASQRYVLLSVRSGGEEFAAVMRRQYGVSLVLAPSNDQLERADALVLFSPRQDLSRENPVLCTLYPGGEERGRVPVALGGAFTTAVADNCAHDQLAAALYEMGIAPPEHFLGEFTC
ncbi:MAG: hypothetical protein IKM11_00505 [Oscillospiraceae bacterium]|nr:hypothetical protein [Oscillospiraceae bacterium]